MALEEGVRFAIREGCRRSRRRISKVTDKERSMPRRLTRADNARLHRVQRAQLKREERKNDPDGSG